MKKAHGAPPGSLFVPKNKEQITDADTYIKQLKEMIEELKTENYEYFKYRYHLIENARSVYEENIILKEAIRERYAYYLELLKYFPELNNRQRIILFSYIYNERHNRFPTVVGSYDEICEKIIAYQNEIKDIEKKVKDLMKMLPEIALKVHHYQILVILLARLIKINDLFWKELQNLLAFNYKSEMIKEKLSRIKEVKIDREKLKDTTDELDGLYHQPSNCLSFYDQVQQSNRKSTDTTENSQKSDFDIWLGIEPIEDSSNNYSKSRSYLKYEKKLAEILQDVTLDEEISELKRIVSSNDYDYLNDKERQDYLRRLQLLFGLIRTAKRDHTKSKINVRPFKPHGSQKVSDKIKPATDSSDFEKVNREIQKNTSSGLSDYILSSISSLNFENPYSSRRFGQPFRIINYDSSPIKRPRFRIEEEEESYEEFQLNLPKPIKLVNVETCTDILPEKDHTIKPPKSKKAGSPRRTFKYDPSIFYTPVLPPARGRLQLEKTAPPRLVVTLKDIGLEGLDSATPDRTQQLKMIEQMRLKKEEESERKSPKRRNYMKNYY